MRADNDGSAQGLTTPTINLAAMTARLKSPRSREVSTRKQVGDAESMVNEEGGSDRGTEL